MNKQVSFDTEPLILVDSSDLEIGSMPKADCHEGEGTLHRAFSVFILNSANQLLLQRRSSQKMLWPLYWSNSCCSHPRKGEDISRAAQRRVSQELGLQVELKEIYKFEYRAEYLDVGSEHELCTVFIGFSDEPVEANENEIVEFRWIDAAFVIRMLKDASVPTTPWFESEWKTLMNDYPDVLIVEAE